MDNANNTYDLFQLVRLREVNNKSTSRGPVNGDRSPMIVRNVVSSKIELTSESKNYLLLGLSGNKRVQQNKLLGRQNYKVRRLKGRFGSILGKKNRGSEILTSRVSVAFL